MTDKEQGRARGETAASRAIREATEEIRRETRAAATEVTLDDVAETFH